MKVNNFKSSQFATQIHSSDWIVAPTDFWCCCMITQLFDRRIHSYIILRGFWFLYLVACLHSIPYTFHRFSSADPAGIRKIPISYEYCCNDTAAGGFSGEGGYILLLEESQFNSINKTQELVYFFSKNVSS